MIHEIILPMLGETMDEGQITAWLKAEGDKVAKGEPLFEVTTDKAAFEAEAPVDGYLRKILIPTSEEAIPVAKLIGYIADSMDEALPAEKPEEKASKPEPAAPGTTATTTTQEPAQAVAQNPAGESGGRIKISPLARKLADQHGLDIEQLRGRGSGPGGRIVKKDVLELAKADSVAKKPAPTVTPGRAVPMSKMRKVIAKRLLESKQTIPHYYLIGKARVDDLIKLRENMVDQVKEARGSRLTYTDLMVKAVGLALMECPTVNATFEGGQIQLAGQANVGLAVAVPDGLVVPVLRDVTSRSLGQIVTERARLVEKARAGKLTVQEMTGGSFTVTNLGTQPIEHFSAIINPPEVGILAVGQISRAAIVEEDNSIVPGSIMHMTLSADHRVVDGAVGAEFLAKLIDLLQRPYQLLSQGI